MRRIAPPMTQTIRQFAQQAIEIEAAAVRGLVLDEQFDRAVRAHPGLPRLGPYQWYRQSRLCGSEISRVV